MPLRAARFGRPGLLGTVARTAIVAGTATATSNAVNARATRRSAEQRAYAEQQSYAPPAPAPAPGGDLVARLAELDRLHGSGALSDAEFAAAKAKLLG
ncbi:SHOCT domain-containing protein [Nocardia harenae]|uniref:SHOCT domain-containing protein n=1 Tax=Nocardia harenae TaxID=358707 RepID=UPI0008378A05|nr:SHOCT domain-containing protein [Nocardia harenae]